MLMHLLFSGLGGTSLLNANVFLECDERTLQLGNWPEEIRSQPKELDRYYQLAKDMLQPAEYPESYPHLNKLSVLEKQAIALGQKENFRRVPQTTFFKNGFNNAGVEMKASTGSGQDCTGVNDGSKNSVLMNYIPDAWNHGAEIFCECEVRYVLPDPSGKGYIVYYAWHGDERKAFKNAFHNDLMWVRAVSPLSLLWEHILIGPVERALCPWCWGHWKHGNYAPLEGTWTKNLSIRRAENVRKR